MGFVLVVFPNRCFMDYRVKRGEIKVDLDPSSVHAFPISSGAEWIGPRE